MRPMFGLMKVIFMASQSELPVLLFVDLPPGDDVGDGGQAGAKRREGRVGVQHAAADGAPAIEAPPCFEDALGELIRTHAPRLEDGVAVAIVRIEPPLR